MRGFDDEAEILGKKPCDAGDDSADVFAGECEDVVGVYKGFYLINDYLFIVSGSICSVDNLFKQSLWYSDPST